MATSSTADLRIRRILTGIAAVYGLVVVAVALATAVASPNAWALTTVLLAGVAGSAAVTMLLFWPRLAHLRSATDAVHAIGAGRFDVRIDARSDEYAPLSDALNAAAARLAQVVGSLRQERAQLEALLNASADAIVAVDRVGTITYDNDAAQSLFEGTHRIGRPFIEVVRDHDLNDLLVAAAARGERSVRVVAYGPTQRWLQATAVPISGGGAWAALAVFHDLTEVRRLEGVRRDFISNVSHELRTPLAGIRAAAETLREGALAEPDAAQEFLQHIERETDRMTQLVEELLELSRIESGAAPLQLAPLDARLLITDAVRRFRQQASRAGLAIDAAPPPGELRVLGDAERLDRALGNLVANALKFTPAGGRVTVSAAADSSGDVLLCVSDTGPGIAADQQARVFERFYKADAGRGSGGTGLGLAIVKHIAQAHGGTVALESRVGRGSTFTIRLPGGQYARAS